MIPAPETRQRGRVLEFDPERGVGSVGEPGKAFFFHCTAIADGTRQIAQGTEVSFQVRPGHQGRWEGADLRPL